MLIAKYKHIIIAFLLLAFVGQALAAANAPCVHKLSAMPQHPTAIPAHAGMMEHAPLLNVSQCVIRATDLAANAIADPSTASTVNTEASVAMVSCPDCDCKVGGCAAMVLSTVAMAFPPVFTAAPSHSAGLAEPLLIRSLYRPPITR